MLFVALGLAAVPVAFLHELRGGWYVVHLLLVAAIGWAVGHFYPYAGGKEMLPIALLIHFVSINVVTFCVYAFDKRAARKKAWRVSERTLHAYALVGGTPAALYAQKKLRHKTKKESFRRQFYVVMAVQVLLLAGAVYWLFF